MEVNYRQGPGSRESEAFHLLLGTLQESEIQRRVWVRVMNLGVVSTWILTAMGVDVITRREYKSP
jgi:hypothetical protein